MARLRVPITSRDHVKGSPWATITLVEFGDYQCPFCGRAFWELQQIERQFARDLRFVFRNFPLVDQHPEAMIAAQAAEAAAAQGRFWEMHDTLYENQDALDFDNLLGYAAHLDLDLDRFIDDIETQRYMDQIENDFMGGVRSGVNGTPCFFINDQRHDGPWDASTLARALERARNQQPQRAELR